MTLTGTHAGKTVIEQADRRVIACLACGYCHLMPLPIEVDQYYQTDNFYKQHSPAGWLQKELDEYRRGDWRAAYAYQAGLLWRHLTLLDVGCSTGTFVHYWDGHCDSPGYGIEPSAMARALALCADKIYPDQTSLAASDAALHIFNVRLALVLEHVPDPLGFIELYRPLLSAIGRLLIIVPNEFNPLQRSVGGDWFVSDVHLNYFSPASLRQLLQRAGLKVIHESATFPMELFIKLGLDYRRDQALGPKLHHLRLHLERLCGPGIYGAYQKLYIRFGIGRELIFVAEPEN